MDLVENYMLSFSQHLHINKIMLIPKKKKKEACDPPHTQIKKKREEKKRTQHNILFTWITP